VARRPERAGSRRNGDIARVDIGALLVAVSDLPRRLVRCLELRVLRSLRLVARLDAEKLLDLVARFDERIGRIRGKSLLELRPAGLIRAGRALGSLILMRSSFAAPPSVKRGQ